MAEYDLNLFNEGLVIEDVVEAAMQELDILFSTEETQLLGTPNYGSNFEQFLWTLEPDKGEVENYIYNKILLYTYYCKELSAKVNCNIVAGTIRDIYQIEITLEDPATKERKIKSYVMK